MEILQYSTSTVPQKDIQAQYFNKCAYSYLSPLTLTYNKYL